jgi:hypothetical protein
MPPDISLPPIGVNCLVDAAAKSDWLLTFSAHFLSEIYGIA